MPVSGPFLEQCDECGKERSYEPSEVRKARVEGSGGLCDSSTLSMKGAPEVSLMHLLFVPKSESNPILDSHS